MAEWCVATGQPPHVYRELTLRQRDEFIRAVERTYRRR